MKRLLMQTIAMTLGWTMAGLNAAQATHITGSLPRRVVIGVASTDGVGVAVLGGEWGDDWGFTGVAGESREWHSCTAFDGCESTAVTSSVTCVNGELEAFTINFNARVRHGDDVHKGAATITVPILDAESGVFVLLAPPTLTLPGGHGYTGVLATGSGTYACLGGTGVGSGVIVSTA